MPDLADLRISAPREVYDSLPGLVSPDLQVAFTGLSGLLGVEHNLGVPPSETWKSISAAMITQFPGKEITGPRPSAENAKRVFELIGEFPWLRMFSNAHVDPSRPVLEREFADVFRGYTVYDHPGLFGLAVVEAARLKSETSAEGFSEPAFAKAAGMQE